ncbi:MAG: threonine--tRNA ligase [Brevinematales bacterium]|nr:threonine--tRNA ligase [Brevinematales bacterium]
MFSVKLLDKSVEFEKPVKIYEILKLLDIQKSKIVAARFNNELYDLSKEIDCSGELNFISSDSEEGLEILRHSASHIMAQAILRIYPDAKFGVGPAIKDGFYYDVVTEAKISEEDLQRIEEEMKKIVAENLPIVREELSKEEAKTLFKKAGQKYKLELIEEIEGDKVSIYKQGDFFDLCRGPHLPFTGMLKAFKLLSVSGAYWRGNEKNDSMTRVYGTAFSDKESLNTYLNNLEEAKKRDHRKLGKELELFSFHDEGPGLPFWKPKGLIFKNLLIEFMREKHRERNYIEIETPTMLRVELWKQSGHYDNYRENMFFTEKDEEVYAIKPMNCPGGILYYKESIHSYRELPLKIAEFGKVHRYERSGVLQGLFRVRGFTQDDAHIFTSPEALQSSVIELLQLIDEVYKTFGFEYSLELSTRPEKSMGTDEQWEIATSGLKNALDELGLNYKINEGDGAFYGPKIDFHLKDAIGRTHQCGTIQLDMNLPERFDLTYIGDDGKEHRVIMLHRAVLGSIERFMGILIEHYGGKFPLWLSPLQVVIIPVSDKFNSYAIDINNHLRKAKIRSEIDLSNEKLGYKIRSAQMLKIPYMFVVGEKEASTNSVSIRHRDRGEEGLHKWEEILKKIVEENQKRL